MLKAINIIPENTNINFLKYYKTLLYVSLLISFVALSLFIMKKPNYGIDFTGGILVEVDFENDVQANYLREILHKKFKDISLQNFDDEKVFVIKIGKQIENSQKTILELQETIKQNITTPINYRKIDFVGPQIGQELFIDAIFALILSFMAISIYLGYRFEWYYGIGTVMSLIHDTVMLLGLYAITNIEFNLASIAAILTVIGYSVNDSVVIYDRIREYTKKHSSKKQIDIINKCINDTLSRTTLTVLTTLIANLILIFFGGEVVRGFSITVFIGILIGTYSSICISVPMLLYLNKNSKL